MTLVGRKPRYSPVIAAENNLLAALSLPLRHEALL